MQHSDHPHAVGDDQQNLPLSPTTGSHPNTNSAFSNNAANNSNSGGLVPPGAFTLDNIAGDIDNTPSGYRNSPSRSPGGISKQRRSSLSGSQSMNNDSFATGSSGNNRLPSRQKNVTSATAIKSKRFRPTLRSVIAGVSALIVLVVAATCVTVSTVVSTDTARDLGLSLARSLVGAARIKAEDYFQGPVNMQQGIARSFRAEGFGLPTDDFPDMKNATKICDLTRPMMIASGFQFPTIGILFESGSLFGCLPYNVSGDLYVGCGMRLQDPPTATFSVNRVEYYYMLNDTRVPDDRIPQSSLIGSTQVENRGSSYFALRNSVLNQRGRTVFTPSISYPRLDGEASLQLGFVAALFNSSDFFLGILAMSIPSETLQEFFQTIQTTKNGNVIALDASTNILASTVRGVQIYEKFWQPAANPTPPGCMATSDVVPTTTEEGIVCPTKAKDYGYPPLQWVANNEAVSNKLFSPREELLEEASIDGTAYYIISTPVENTGVAFSLTIMFFLPEDDILGDIRAGRNLSIYIAAAIFVVSILACALLIFALLKPINVILNQMINASQLRLDDKNENEFGNSASKYNADGSPKSVQQIQDEEEAQMSSIQEIFALQKTYSDMAIAFRCFTNYVSVDILADILDSGELARLGLKGQQATMLFNDIANFTSICERTDITVLSNCLTVYFEGATSIVKQCGGVVNNFIGDAQLLTFGCPSVVANQEIKAVICGMLITRATTVAPIQTVWDDAGEFLSIRTGINSGFPSCGNIGSQSRMSYTVLGDSVNLAARLESLNKQTGTRIMISDDVATKTNNVFLHRLLFPVQVVGKEDAVKVWEPVGIKHNILVETALGGDERSMSMDIAQQSASMNVSGAIGQTAHISRRKEAQVTARSIIEKAMALRESTVVASEAEAKFVFEYNNVAQRFCDQDGQGCLDGLQKLRAQYPLFFDDREIMKLKEVCGHERCDALLIRADVSASKLEASCKKAMQDQESEMQENVSFGGMQRTNSGFVFRAEEK